MAKKKITIIWSKDADTHFAEILEFLFLESPAAAAIVANGILSTIEKLPDYPFSHPLDRFRKNNSKNFRACIVYCYRISYFANYNSIIILRIRHTSREPLKL